MILIHQIRLRNVKTQKNNNKYNSMDTTASMMLKHSQLLRHIAIHVCKHTVQEFSIQKDQVPESRTDMSCAGRRCAQQRILTLWSSSWTFTV